MNANELAEKLLDCLSSEDRLEIRSASAQMLRKQQAEIEALKQIIDANNLNQNIGQFVKPTNEPVAWINKTGSHGYLEWDKDDEVDESIPLYTHPVSQYKAITNTKIEPTVVSYTHPVKELTDEEIDNLIMDVAEKPTDEDLYDFARAILRKAGEK